MQTQWSSSGSLTRKLKGDWWKAKLCTSCVSPLGRILSRGGHCPQCGLRVCKNCRHYYDVSNGNGNQGQMSSQQHHQQNWICILCSGSSPNFSAATLPTSIGKSSTKSIRRSWTISNPQRGSHQNNSPVLKSYTIYDDDNTTCSTSVRQFNSLPRMSYGNGNRVQDENRPVQRGESEQKMGYSTLYPFKNNKTNSNSSVNFIEDPFWDYYDYNIINSNRSSCERSLGETEYCSYIIDPDEHNKRSSKEIPHSNQNQNHNQTLPHVPVSRTIPIKPERSRNKRSNSLNAYDGKKLSFSPLRTYVVLRPPTTTTTTSPSGPPLSTSMIDPKQPPAIKKRSSSFNLDYCGPKRNRGDRLNDSCEISDNINIDDIKSSIYSDLRKPFPFREHQLNCNTNHPFTTRSHQIQNYNNNNNNSNNVSPIEPSQSGRNPPIQKPKRNIYHFNQNDSGEENTRSNYNENNFRKNSAESEKLSHDFKDPSSLKLKSKHSFDPQRQSNNCDVTSKSDASSKVNFSVRDELTALFHPQSISFPGGSTKHNMEPPSADDILKELRTKNENEHFQRPSSPLLLSSSSSSSSSPQTHKNFGSNSIQDCSESSKLNRIPKPPRKFLPPPPRKAISNSEISPIGTKLKPVHVTDSPRPGSSAYAGRISPLENLLKKSEKILNPSLCHVSGSGGGGGGVSPANANFNVVQISIPNENNGPQIQTFPRRRKSEHYHHHQLQPSPSYNNTNLNLASNLHGRAGPVTGTMLNTNSNYNYTSSLDRNRKYPKNIIKINDPSPSSSSASSSISSSFEELVAEEVLSASADEDDDDSDDEKESIRETGVGVAARPTTLVGGGGSNGNEMSDSGSGGGGGGWKRSKGSGVVTVGGGWVYQAEPNVPKREQQLAQEQQQEGKEIIQQVCRSSTSKSVSNNPNIPVDSRNHNIYRYQNNEDSAQVGVVIARPNTGKVDSAVGGSSGSGSISRLTDLNSQYADNSRDYDNKSELKRNTVCTGPSSGPGSSDQPTFGSLRIIKGRSSNEFVTTVQINNDMCNDSTTLNPVVRIHQIETQRQSSENYHQGRPLNQVDSNPLKFKLQLLDQVNVSEHEGLNTNNSQLSSTRNENSRLSPNESSSKGNLDFEYLHFDGKEVDGIVPSGCEHPLKISQSLTTTSTSSTNNNEERIKLISNLSNTNNTSRGSNCNNNQSYVEDETETYDLEDNLAFLNNYISNENLSEGDQTIERASSAGNSTDDTIIDFLQQSTHYYYDQPQKQCRSIEEYEDNCSNADSEQLKSNVNVGREKIANVSGCDSNYEYEIENESQRSDTLVDVDCEIISDEQSIVSGSIGSDSGSKFKLDSKYEEEKRGNPLINSSTRSFNNKNNSNCENLPTVFPAKHGEYQHSLKDKIQDLIFGDQPDFIIPSLKNLERTSLATEPNQIQRPGSNNTYQDYLQGIKSDKLEVNEKYIATPSQDIDSNIGDGEQSDVSVSVSTKGINQETPPSNPPSIIEIDVYPDEVESTPGILEQTLTKSLEQLCDTTTGTNSNEDLLQFLHILETQQQKEKSNERHHHESLIAHGCKTKAAKHEENDNQLHLLNKNNNNFASPMIILEAPAQKDNVIEIQEVEENDFEDHLQIQNIQRPIISSPIPELNEIDRNTRTNIRNNNTTIMEHNERLTPEGQESFTDETSSTTTTKRSSPDGEAIQDIKSTKLLEEESFQVTSSDSDNSWIEEIPYEEGPPPLDLTLHTIVEESCEDSAEESEKSLQLHPFHRKPLDDLENYFNYLDPTLHPGDPLSNMMDNHRKLANEDSEFSDTFSESSFNSEVHNNSHNHEEDDSIDPVDLASTRLEKYFTNLSYINNPEEYSEDSVGSESECDDHVKDKKKKVFKHKRSANVSDDESIFDLDEGAYDTIKKSSKKKQQQQQQQLHQHQQDKLDKHKQLQDSSFMEATTSSSNKLTGTVDKSEEQNSSTSLNPTDAEISSNSSNQTNQSRSTSKSKQVLLNRSNSFQWSSDEEVNLMMSKLRHLVKNLMQKSQTTSTGEGNERNSQLRYFETELIRLMRSEPELKNIVSEYISSEESDDNEFNQFIKEVVTQHNEDQGGKYHYNPHQKQLSNKLNKELQFPPGVGLGLSQSSQNHSPSLITKVLHHIDNRLSVWMKDDEEEEILKCAPSVSSDLNEDRFSWKGSFESTLAAKRQSVGSTDSISSSDLNNQHSSANSGVDRSILRSSSLHHLANSQPIEEKKEEEENISNSLPRLNQVANMSRAQSLIGIKEKVKSARYRPPGFTQAPSIIKQIDDKMSMSTPALHQDNSCPDTPMNLRSSADSISSMFEHGVSRINVRGQIEFGLQYNYKLASLEVRVKQCRDLAAVDTKRNRSDPYVKAYLLPDRSKSGKRKTKTKKNTLNPIFEETLKFPLTLSELQSRTLWLSVWHSDIFGKNEFLGQILISLKDRVFDDPSPTWWSLEEMSVQVEDQPRGDLIIALKWQPRTQSTGNLSVLVKEAKNLLPIKNVCPSTFVKCSPLKESKSHRSKQKTSIARRTLHPIWNQTLYFEDISDDGVEVSLWNHDLLSNHDLIGSIRLDCNSPLWESMLNRHSFWVEGGLKLDTQT